MVNVGELMNDPDFAASYTIVRTSGNWNAGRFVTDTQNTIQYFGPVQPATEDELQQIPEGDRDKGIMKFMCAPPKRIYITQTTAQGGTSIIVSDQVVYQGEIYKIIKVKDWRQNGYTRAFGYSLGAVQ